MNTKYAKSIFGRPIYILAILAVTLLVTLGVTSWRAAAQGAVPSLRAHPVWESVDGWNWPLGANLKLTIEDLATEETPDLQMEMIVEEDPTGSNWFDFNGVYDLKPGDVVTLSDGTTTRILTVSTLSINAVDVKNDTAEGVAEPGAQVRIPTSGGELFVTVSPDEDWFADFKTISFNLKPGTMLIAEVHDEDGDLTSFERYIPNPRIVASTAGDWFWTSEFNPGPLDLSIYATSDTDADPLWQGIVDSDAGGFAFIGSDFHGQDLVPGNYLVVSDGVNEKGLLLERITMEVFDIDNEIMAGTAPLGREVWAAAGPAEWQERIMVIADPVSGAWMTDFKAISFDISEDMRPWSYAHIYDEDGDANEAGTPPPLPSTWRDDFNPEALLPGWYWQNGDSGEWSLGDTPGFLSLVVSNSSSLEGNVLLRKVQNGDFVIKTHLSFEPDTNYQFAGLYIYQDDQHTLAFGRAFCDNPDGCVGNGIYFDKVLGGEAVDGNFAMAVNNPSDAYLRLERRGDTVKAFFSYEGITWVEIGTHLIPSEFQVNGVGLFASQDFDASDQNISAAFDYFELTEGWGFLPEGFHDYDSGDVPSWACNAGGWAADPDDRAADLAIEINVDGTSLPDWLSASEYREDLDNAGVCVDGNCGFATSLWGTISSYEPHTIVAYAQDIPSGEWVQLSNSPKPLTCRTYDIYAYDPLTRETSQITDLRDTDEYNPGWSPNGKKVAHDVVGQDGSLLGIYITDLKTGLSTPLTGAENGNDAVWSPVGDWITFDRDSSLYIVHSDGGRARLVESDAVSANWAPSGRRLVFQRPSDGSIWTVAVNGGKGRDTLIAASGANPSWSPDGSWIAYEKNGDIWKVPVNVQGIVLGVPIQVTSLIAGEGQPTWSADSQTIIYHAGLGRDYDLWSAPAAGGMPTWLTGAPEFGDYDPEYARDSNYIAYASFSPEGQASRTWVSAFTYDLPSGFWEEGNHIYHFETSVGENTPDMSFEVSNELPLYEGSVLLRPWAIIANVFWGWDCTDIGMINQDQPTKFFVGWTADGTYSEAMAYYEALNARVAWDGEMPVSLLQQETFPITSTVDWYKYACKSTNAPARILVQITEDWFVAQRFATDTELTYWIYESEGGELVTSGTMWSNSNGTADAGVGDTWDLQPGNYLVISDGITTKDIVLENLIFEELDVNTGHVEGTAPGPFGRSVWIGVGFLGERWTTTSAPYGFWEAEFDQPVPWNYQWAAAQIFDTDGDISEVRPVEVTTRWMYLRVNYGHDWVESFYEPDHDVVITVTEGDGVTVKATANVRTEPKDFWNGDTGFQTQGSDWYPAPPDIRPYDWVYATVDNGITAQVQIGEISGEIDLDADSVHGTVIVPGFSGEVGIECHPWGSPNPVDMKFDATFADGADLYSCSWDPATEWDIQYYQDVGVGYFGPDGHWVANAFFVRNPRFTVFPEWEGFDSWDWPDGATVAISVDNKPECYVEKVSSDFFFNGNFGEGCNLEIGDTVIFSDGTTTRTHVVQNLAITDVNKDANTVAGTADVGAVVYVWVHGYGETNMELIAGDGTWLADFGGIPFDLLEGMGGRSEIRDEVGNSTAVDWYIPNPRFTVFPEWEFFDGYDWPDGAFVAISVESKPECAITKESWSFFFNGNFGEGCNLEIGDTVTFTDGTTTRTHLVQNLAITDANKDGNTISGTADPGAIVHVWPHDAWFGPLQATADDQGSWQVDLDDVGYDIQEGASGRSQVYDDAGNATAVDWYIPNPHIVASITDNWFYLADFIPGETLNFAIYQGQGEALVWEGAVTADVNGFAWINPEDRWDLEPGYYIDVSDGTTTKDLVIEGFTFDVFDLTSGFLQGTAPEPFGRRVWVGIGWENDGWSMDVITNESGYWVADYGGPVPGGYLWVAAQIFDADGDASELRPAQVLGN